MSIPSLLSTTQGPLPGKRKEKAKHSPEYEFWSRNKRRGLFNGHYHFLDATFTSPLPLELPPLSSHSPQVLSKKRKKRRFLSKVRREWLERGGRESLPFASGIPSLRSKFRRKSSGKRRGCLTPLKHESFYRERGFLLFRVDYL